MHRFETSYRHHLATEQRRAVLHALRDKLDPGVTMGEVLDAAEALGFGEQLGELSLQDLADALLTPVEKAANTAVRTRPEPAPVADDTEPLQEHTTAKREPTQRTAKRSDTANSGTAKRSDTANSGTANSGTANSGTANSGTANSGTAKKTVPPKSSRLRALKKKIDAEERMSLDEAAEVFVPVIEEMDQATMQDLEAFTGIGRRKLRFHVGQLVREGYIERHGMGRGTYYTVG